MNDCLETDGEADDDGDKNKYGNYLMSLVLKNQPRRIAIGTHCLEFGLGSLCLHCYVRDIL